MRNFGGKIGRIAVASLLAVGMAVQVFAAAAFPDVSEEKYAWAYKEISSMADDGIIKGYEDGTFRPENVVTKLEALSLVARILGSGNEANEALCAFATDHYAADLEKYELPYGEEEISFLLVKGLLTTDELDGYISQDNQNVGLKRYEVAILLTKAMGAEDEVKSKLITSLDYSDTNDIPSTAKKYVEYVTEQGLMQGMEANTFVPMGDVTRAQAAVVLYNLQELAQYDSYQGIVASVESANDTIRIKDIEGEDHAYTIPDAAKLRFEGEEIDTDGIAVGMEAVVTTSGGSLFSIDFITAQTDEEVSGKYVGTGRADGVATIKIDKIGAVEDERKEYKVADTIVVTKDGESAALTDLKAGDFVTLNVTGGKVVTVTAEAGSKRVKGKVTDIILEPTFILRVKVTGGEEQDFYAGSSVKVAKNGATATLNDILIGDTVQLTTEYSLITNIEATSSTDSFTGVIEEVNVSSSPSITLKVDGKSVSYPVARDAEILLDDKAGTIYDLRLNVNAKITVESDTVVKIETKPAENVTQVTGTVEIINPAYNMLGVTYVDPETKQSRTDQIFVKKAAAIISSSDGKSKDLDDISVGQTVSVIGSINTGIFEATTVVIID